MSTLISTYKQKWNKYRFAIIERDMDACVACGRGPDTNAVLQVHHKIYRKGLRPWEYPYEDCETLCKRCHAEKHGKIIPSTGWEFVGEEDLGDLIGICDYCGNEIRYSFFVIHENWEPMDVGTICCDNLTGTTLASTRMESIHRFENRRKRFTESPRWKVDRFNGLTIVQRNIRIKIALGSNGFRICLNDIKGKRAFSSLENAKGFVFELIETGRAEKYFKSREAKNKG